MGIRSLSDIVHIFIRKTDTFGCSSSSREIQLKSTLPTFCYLNRAVRQALSPRTSNCCLLAQCLYISSCDNTVKRKTAAEYKRDSRQKYTALHQHEQSLDTARRKRRRRDTDVRQQEQTADTGRRKQRRQDTDVRQQEQTADTARHKGHRQNAEYRQPEQISDTARKRLQHDCHSVADLIRQFHTAVATGPVFVCTACDQLMYKHSVQKASIVRSLPLSVTQSVLLDTVSSDGVEYICNACSKYSRRNKIPPCAIANDLQFLAFPSHLPTLTVAE